MKQHKATARQCEFLSKLKEMAAKGIEPSYNELAKVMDVSEQAVTAMAGRLARDGYVQLIPYSERRLRLLSEAVK
jgi:Mn-dependent DtxR family transcriptional regulator